MLALIAEYRTTLMVQVYIVKWSRSQAVLCFALPETNPHQGTEVLRLKGTLGPIVTIAGSKWHCRAPESESRLFSHLRTNTLIQIIANLTPKHFQMNDLGVLLAGRDCVYQSSWAIMSRSSLGPVILTWHWAGKATFPPKRNPTPFQKRGYRSRLPLSLLIYTFLFIQLINKNWIIWILHLLSV